MKTIVTEITNRKAFFKGTDCLKVGYPWLTFGAIIAVESLVNPKAKVLEFGSGGSTVFWAKNCESVISYETDRKWHAKVKDRIQGLKNVELKLANEEETIRDIAGEADCYFDFVLIDSQPRHARRLLIANAVASKVKLGGFMIIDNYQRFGMNYFNYSAWEVFTFDEFGYTGQGTRLCRKVQM